MLGHHWPASEMPFEWHFAGGPMMACCILPPLINRKKQTFWIRPGHDDDET